MTTATRLYLVRHAHAVWRPDESRPLSPRGRKDAEHVARLLAPLGIGAIYSSPSRRAVETIAPLATQAGLSPVLLDDLRERELPVQAPEAFESAVESSWRNPEKGVGDGESNRTAQARGVRAIQSVLSAHSGERIVVSTHGNLLALVLNAFDSSFGYQFWTRMTFPDVYETTFDHTGLESVDRIYADAVEPGAPPDAGG